VVIDLAGNGRVRSAGLAAPCSAARPMPNARAPPAYTEVVQISAKVDYGVRALLVLATSSEPMTVDAIAADQEIPSKFLGVILNDLRRVGILVSHRGREAGYNLGRPPSDITLADVIRALEGPLAQVRGLAPETVKYDGVAEHLQEVWVALRASLRAVLESVSLENIAKGDLPGDVAALVAAPGAWVGR
jgi:Rrf2 family protein